MYVYKWRAFLGKVITSHPLEMKGKAGSGKKIKGCKIVTCRSC